MFKAILLVFMCVLSLSLSLDPASMETLKKLADNLCGPELPADKAKIISECEKGFPKVVSIVKSIFQTVHSFILNNQLIFSPIFNMCHILLINYRLKMYS